jgi:hypothetical protein
MLRKFTFLSGEICPTVRSDGVSSYHSVILPAGATDLPSPGDIIKASRLISRDETKGEPYRLVMDDCRKTALYEVTHEVIGQKSAEAILAKCLL